MVFEVFLASLGIRHGLVLLWHPAGNGMAKCMVHTTKETLAKLAPEIGRRR